MTEWLPLHIFYAGNPNPLLAECVAPMTGELRRRGLIQRYFFIRYWQEGPHIRLRLLPSSAELADEVRTFAESAVNAFLTRRPALFSVDPDQVNDYHKDMFVAEYGEQAWDEQYGEAGMPLRENNSFAYIPYEPEYDRYGGPSGVRLAEWHFEQSSDLVLRLVAEMNVHVRTVMFGLSAQVGLILSHSFRPTAGSLAWFLQHYHEFWSTTYPSPRGDLTPEWDKLYDKSAESLVQRIAAILEAMRPDGQQRLADFLQSWAAHCAELRDRVVDLSERGELIFRSPDVPGVRVPVTDPDLALGILLSAYLHMTNNRLGVSVHDEAYLAYMMRRAVLDADGART